MKVLHVVPTLDPRQGGPGAAARGMAKHLLAQGVDTLICATTAGPQWPSDGVPTVQLPVTGSAIFPLSFAYSPRLARWMEERVGDFDILHVHTIFNFTSAWACRVARRRDVPYVVSTCGMLDPWSLAQRRVKKSIWLRVIERANLNGAAAIHATSEEERRAASRYVEEAACVVIPLGVDLPRPRIVEPVIVESVAGRKRILFLSRIGPGKGLERIVAALSGLRLRDDFSFVIAGSGAPAYEQQLRRLVSAAGLDPVTQWSGFVSGETKDRLFRSADIFVLPSEHENFGIAIAEAMSYGKAVVISDRVHMHRLVNANSAGIVIGAGGESLAQALQRLLGDAALRARYGANAASVAARYFSWSSITPQLVDLYRRCVKDRPVTA